MPPEEIAMNAYRKRVLGYLQAILNELGNRRFGIPSPQHYQRGTEWTAQLASQGWTMRTMIHSCRCHSGLLGALSNRLQYVALYERGEDRLAAAKLQSR